ncbi:CPBP family intramembrane glutamic endopeptidase [Desulforamulus ferrireducens]|uniref:CPBP family intramembrane glutamic endopeptidase n=1 Tax=Desulforamulus ferrireducens TaxID=1833852 RepID=UPI00135664D2|nr:CPBP family intramembrane glutamic endopeptidase [Desulforamulus ferrireducens]
MLILFCGMLALWFFYVRQGIGWQTIYQWGSVGLVLGYGTLMAAILVLMQILLATLVPHHLLLDDGTNRVLYSFSYPNILLLMGLGAFAEETLFRAAMQPKLGILLTSVLFALIHVRYLKKWVLLLGTVVMSMALGWLYQKTQIIWAPIWAHFLVNVTMICFGKRGLFVPQDTPQSSSDCQ